MRKNSARVACLSFAVVLFSAQLQAETLLEIYDLAISNAPQLKAAEATYKTVSYTHLTLPTNREV